MIRLTYNGMSAEYPTIEAALEPLRECLTIEAALEEPLRECLTIEAALEPLRECLTIEAALEPLRECLTDGMERY